MEVIRHRRSVRTFDGEGVTAETAQKIADCAAAAGNPYNLPIKYSILDKCYLHILFCDISGYFNIFY